MNPIASTGTAHGGDNRASRTSRAEANTIMWPHAPNMVSRYAALRAFCRLASTGSAVIGQGRGAGKLVLRAELCEESSKYAHSGSSVHSTIAQTPKLGSLVPGTPPRAIIPAGMQAGVGAGDAMGTIWAPR